MTERTAVDAGTAAARRSDRRAEEVREIADRYGILLILDEVMAGFGRTGEWFAFDAYGVRPDLITFAKVDSGGVSSGPMTATFILSFAQGVANSTEGADVLLDGFGVIAMVAMTPLIALQILGLVFKIKSAKGGKKND